MTSHSLRLLAIAAALSLLAVVLQDAFEVMLLPRRVQRRLRLMRIYFRGAWRLWASISRRVPAGQRRESFLSHFGALSMLLLFGLWAIGLILGFGTLEWGLQSRAPGAAVSPFIEQLYMSGVTFFTLGYGDVVPHTDPVRLVTVLEAGTGFGLIAVVIGYLPVLYQLFSRREAHVIQLDGRAGSPPTAGTLLVRHTELGGLDMIDELLREWEVWGSELLESHLSYPMLAYYRSQHDNQSWLAAIACIMDVCALVLVGIAELRPLQARMTFTMARQVVVEMARSFGVQPSRYTGGDRLDEAAYERLAAALVEAGVPWEPGAEGRHVLAALRATYEPLLDGLSRHLLVPLSGFLPDHTSSDQWARGHRGLIAGRLIEELAARAAPGAGELDRADLSTWRKLRRRLRANEEANR